jgi:hypothetical protein
MYFDTRKIILWPVGKLSCLIRETIKRFITMTSSGAEQKRQQQLIKNYNLRFNLRALHLCGVLPTESISSSPWKSRLYDLYTCLTLIWFIPAITAMCIELCNNLDSLEKAIPIIFQISAFVLSAILGMYFVHQRKFVMKLFYTLETRFRPHMERVRASTKQLKTMEESFYTGKLISNMSFGAGMMTVFIWVVIPSVKGYVEFLLDINQEDIEQNRGKYFGLAMWFPSNVNKSPVYEIAQILHGFTVFTGVLNITGWYLAMLSLMYHISSHFKMLVNLIEDAGVICSEHRSSEQQPVPTVQRSINVGQLHIEDDCGEGSQRLVADRDTRLDRYLISCVKYHQEIIE